jgi:predicted ATPase
MTTRSFSTELTTFVGRQRELAALTSFLHDGENRLIAILGPGGAGKTRLAKAFLQSLSEPSLFFCDLAETRTLESLVASVAAMLGLSKPARSTQELIERVGHALSSEESVVVLDNFEQVITHASVVSHWLSLAPSVRFVVTSRERLDLDGEQVLELSSLDPRDALHLFERRARAVRPGWSVEQHRETVAAICDHLDGMPLAIELAAARMEILSPAELLSRMNQRFQLLRGGRGRATKRHASLRAAIDWSWDLLSDVERAALRQLAIFKGGFTLKAAEAVLLGTVDVPAIDLVQALRKASLLRLEEQPDTDLRFALYETVREYALERLHASDERPLVEDRHADWCLSEVEHWAAQHSGAHAQARHRRIERELDNALAAIQHSLPNEPERAARLILAIHETVAARGRHSLLAELLNQGLDAGRRIGNAQLLARLLVAHLTELVTRQGRSDVDDELARARLLAVSCGDVSLQARLFILASTVEGRRGDAARSKELLESALSASIESRDLESEAMARRLLFAREFESGDLVACRSQIEQALAICRRIDHRELLGRVLYNLGILESVLGRKDSSRDYALQCLQIQRSLGNEVGESDALKLLGTLALDGGREDEARQHFVQALEILRRAGDRINEAVALRWLGDVEVSAGHLTAAEQLYRSALLVHRAVSEPRMEGFVLVQLGLVACERQSFTEATEWLDQSEALFARVADPTGLAVVHCYRSAVLAGQGRLEQAGAVLSEGRKLLESIGVRQMLPMAAAFEALLTAKVGDLHSARVRLTQLESGAKDERSYLVRVALRLLRKALPEAPERHTPPPDGTPTLSLAVTTDGRAFRMNAEPAVDLTRRRSMRLLLLRLCEQHRASPGGALTVDQLFAAGWPGEKALPEAGARRVYVAISTLRSLGLGHALVTRDDGYLLHPQTTVTELAS